MPSLHRHTKYSVWSYQWHAKETLIPKNDLLDIFEICFNPLQHVLKLRKLFKVSGHLLLGIAKVFSCLCIETSKYFPHCYVTHTHLHFENTECFSANSLSKRRKQNIKTNIYFPQLFQVRTCLNNIPNSCSNWSMLKGIERLRTNFRKQLMPVLTDPFLTK